MRSEEALSVTSTCASRLKLQWTSDLYPTPIDTTTPTTNRRNHVEEALRGGAFAAGVARKSQRLLNRPSRLLALPTELQLLIYEYALAEEEDDDFVIVTGELKVPALFSINRQIRMQAIRIWFCEVNEFIVEIYDCDANLVRKFLSLYWSAAKDLDFSAHSSKMSLGVVLYGQRDWANLHDWCRRVWKGELYDFPALDEGGQTEAVVTAATQTAEQHKGRSWEECEAALETLRRVVGKFEPQWLA